MSELPIPAEAIEAAARAIAKAEGGRWPPRLARLRVTREADAEAALRAGLEAWGFEVEQCFVDGTDPYIGYRVISRWLPVEQGER